MPTSAPTERPERPGITAGDRLRYMVFGQVVPAVLFIWLGWFQLQRLAHICDNNACHDVFGWLGGPVRLGFYSLFCLVPVVIYITRPMPTARDGSFPARVAAITGTTILLWVGAYGASPVIATPPQWVEDAMAVVLAVFTGLELFTLLSLRLNYSIIPEARGLVRTGPYAIVRHPLYFTEIVVAFAVVVAGPPRVLPALALLPFVAVQYARTRMEERLLSRTFPEYADYRRHTSRLIPYVW